MGYSVTHIEALKEGKQVKFRPHGSSMTPRIESGNLVTVDSVVDEFELDVGDIVLCKVRGKIYLHLISKIGEDGRYMISNNHGHDNGWTTRDKIYGIVTTVEH